VLFHVVNDRHLRKRPMIFTTNKPMTEWGKVLHDEDMAAAILDRFSSAGALSTSMDPRENPSSQPGRDLARKYKTAQNFRNWWLRISGTHKTERQQILKLSRSAIGLWPALMAQLHILQ